MIRSFTRQMRLVLPPGWVTASVAVGWLALELCCWTRGWQPESISLRDLWLPMAASLYGLYRCTKHPLFNSGYRRWLATTPWTVAKPLPLGPLQPAWQDAVVLGLLTVSIHDAYFSRWMMLSAWLLAYGLPIAASLWRLGLWRHAYTVLFLLALMICLQPWFSPWLISVAVVLAVLQQGIDAMLEQFPWEIDDDPVESLSKSQRPRDLYGWPHGVLAPGIPGKVGISYRNGIAVSLLTGWWLYAISAHFPPADRDAGTILFLSILTVVCCGVRLWRYLEFHRPPQTRLGMLSAGRLITPRFDVVFVAPLLAAIVSWAAIALTRHLSGTGDLAGIVAPLGVSAVLLITLNVGPIYANWSLTGDHRTAGGLLDAQRLRKI